jgi:hypothetical protein
MERTFHSGKTLESDRSGDATLKKRQTIFPGPTLRDLASLSLGCPPGKAEFSKTPVGESPVQLGCPRHKSVYY